MCLAGKPIPSQCVPVVQRSGLRWHQATQSRCCEQWRAGHRGESGSRRQNSRHLLESCAPPATRASLGQASSLGQLEQHLILFHAMMSKGACWYGKPLGRRITILPSTTLGCTAPTPPTASGCSTAQLATRGRTVAHPAKRSTARGKSSPSAQRNVCGSRSDVNAAQGLGRRPCAAIR